MSALQVWDYDLYTVRTIEINGEIWFVAKDVAIVLDYIDVRRMVDLVDEEDKQNINPQDKKYNKYAAYFDENIFRLSLVNYRGLRSIIVSSRKPQAINLAKQLGLEILAVTKQQEYIHILEAAFEDLYPVKEFKVSNYRLDLYLAKANIAIECDENNHKQYSEEKEIERQNIIKAFLGCKFVRFNPDSKNFNIGKVIKEVRDCIST